MLKNIKINDYFKYIMVGILILSLCGALCSCGDKKKSDDSNSKTNSQESKKSPADKEVLDLTKMSSTAIYSEVYNMMVTPEDFEGREIKVSGFFGTGKVEGKDKVYFYCVVPDATECCQQGLEFIRKDSNNFPEDFPPEGTRITINGYFETYQEEGQKLGKYCRIRDAKMEINKSNK